MNILGVCSIAVDTICQVDHLPIKDSFCNVLSSERLQGGSGTNVLVQAAKLGASTGVITQVAQDADSDWIMDNLARRGIDSRGVVRRPGEFDAPSCLIYVDPHGEKMLVVSREHRLPPLEEERADLSLIEEADIVYLDLNPAELNMAAAQRAHAAGKKVVINFQEDLESILSQGVDRTFLTDILAYVDVFAPCQEAIRALSGSDELSGQVEFIRRYYPGLIVLTLGAQGVVAYDERDREIRIPAVAIEARDTTGAGDSFIGSFMVSHLVEHMDLKAALWYSTWCAAYTCLDFGAQASPTAEQVQRFMESV
ncbi:PfkB domain protein [Coriobacterium glomerans PW2]|uniref:PfkB domain protein n=1 Tax=Coriobacterium glomerans (strain ATCC 49209 / DSM 20642 / JCM 10262 / PW2) TaxID=700015 RepID=F2N8A6_CORGP|nr:carbohydrate kinase family protein [Coriobacterium glomerans]AEB07289.1 PfkB domain protein [Coriobacterium glomerans PW2]